MKEIITTFHPKHSLQESDPKTCKDNTKCILCEKLIFFPSISYYCRACDFHFHQECATTLMKSNLTIDHPPIHEHTLTFIREKNYFTCDACGKVDEQKMNMYGCLLCDFFVHKNCIYLPKMIKVTHHPHCLFHTLQLSGDYMNCQICNEELVYGSGGYICIVKTCVYKVHSYCATNGIVWEGKDVEASEEINSSEDAAPLSLKEENGKTIIRHFSHDNDLMKLDVDDEDEDEDGQVCQACILPIDIGSFLGCKESNFALHYTCASLPHKMKHILHLHALILEADVMKIKDGFFTCSICDQESCGFMYRCSQEECGFKLDSKCASFAEPFHHKAHKHPLSLLQSSDNRLYRCWSCYQYKSTSAACYDCEFYLDFKCVFIREVAKWKYDPHPLTLYFPASGNHPEQKVRSVYARTMTSSMWCEICEVEIEWDKSWKNQKFYICYDCHTTIHTECLMGKYPYMKPGHIIKVNGFEIQIALNRSSRRKCHRCKCISHDKLIFISTRDNSVRFCSIKCIRSSAKAI